MCQMSLEGNLCLLVHTFHHVNAKKMAACAIFASEMDLSVLFPPAHLC